MAAAAEEAEEEDDGGGGGVEDTISHPPTLFGGGGESERGPVKDAVIKDLLSCMLARVCVCRSGPLGDKKGGAS